MNKKLILEIEILESGKEDYKISYKFDFIPELNKKNPKNEDYILADIFDKLSKIMKQA